MPKELPMFGAGSFWARFRVAVGIIYHMFVRPWPGFSILLLLIGAISGMVPFLQVWAIGGLVDSLQVRAGGGGDAQVTVLSVLAQHGPWVGLFALTLFTDLIVKDRNLLTYIGTVLDVRLRQRFYGGFLRKASGLRLEFFESTAYYDRVEQIRQAFRQSLTEPMLNLQRFVAIGMSMVVILWQLATVHWVIPLLLIPGAMGITRLRTQLAGNWWRIHFEQTSLRRRLIYWRNLLTERDPAAEVRLFGLKEHIARTWTRLSGLRLEELARLARDHFYRQIPLNMLLACFSCLAFLLLLFEAIDGHISVGRFLGLLYVVLQFEGEIEPLGQRLEAFTRLVLDMKSVDSFLKLDTDEPTDGVEIPSARDAEIRFENVSFAYSQGGKTAVKNISFHICPGEKVALVGENGAGKSTLAKLLLGLYRPVSGEIVVGGVPLHRIKPENWRKHICAIMQDFVRYSFSVRENIGFGDLEKLGDDAAIKAAAAASGAAAFVDRLSKGYETRLGREFKDGHDLSLGQWQKLALARAYLRDSDVLVLDEPTSALDPMAELDMYRQFLSLSENKTVLLISHRLGSARLVDRILFVEDGEIKESGTHAELMAANGAYAAMYRMQAEWYQEEVPQ